jgi:predicted nucleic acid-binding protein
VILDWCFLIDLMARDDAAVALLDDLIAEATPLSVVSLSVTEVGSGLRSEAELARFDDVLDRMSVLPYRYKDARRAARLQRRLKTDGRRIGNIDSMIAAIALGREEKVVTRNISEFRRVDGVRVVPY